VIGRTVVDPFIVIFSGFGPQFRMIEALTESIRIMVDNSRRRVVYFMVNPAK